MIINWIFLGSVLFPILALAQGGPPLVTDDPGTPGDGHWEINIVSSNESSSTESLFQIPYFDINYGWGDHIQLKVETGGAIFTGQEGAQIQSDLLNGWGGALAGVKWRFLDEETSGISISTYPQYYFGFFLTSPNPVIGQPGNWFYLPLEFTKKFGHLAINPELGYEFYWQGPNQYVAGVVTSYELDKLELLGELHDNIKTDQSGATLLYNLGFRFDFTSAVSLLFSAGHTLQTFPGEQAEILSYLGVQFRL